MKTRDHRAFSCTLQKLSIGGEKYCMQRERPDRRWNTVYAARMSGLTTKNSVCSENGRVDIEKKIVWSVNYPIQTTKKVHAAITAGLTKGFL